MPTTSMLEISHTVNCLAVDDKTKFLLMENNKPPTGFKFPAKQYKDKWKKGEEMNRYCWEEWFRDFDFISYSIEQDGLYCNTCVLFILKTESQTRTSQTYLSPNHVKTGKTQNQI